MTKYIISINDETLGSLMIDQGEDGLWRGTLLYSPAQIKQAEAKALNPSDTELQKRIRILKASGQEGDTEHQVETKTDTSVDSVLEHFKKWVEDNVGEFVEVTFEAREES